MLLRYAQRPWAQAPVAARTLLCPVSAKQYHPSPALGAKQMPPRPKVNEEDLQEAFLRGSGPGGQKINKTSSAVQLKHLPTGIVVKSQATRSRSQNRKIARTHLAEKLEVLEKGDRSRVAIKQEVKRKKKASATKKSKRKYKALQEGAQSTQDETEQAEQVEEAEEVKDTGPVHEK